MAKEEDEKNVRDAGTGSAVRAHGFVHKTFIVFGIGAIFLVAGVLLWHATQVLLLVFAGVLVAILLRDAGTQLRRLLPVSQMISTALALVLVLVVLTVGGWLLAPHIGEQVMQLLRDLPAALQRLRDYLQNSPVLQYVGRWLPDPEQLAKAIPSVAAQAGTLFSGVLGGLVNFVIIFFVSVYFALQPGPYVNGIIKLLPQHRRQRGKEVLQELDETMTYWLRGKLVSMLVVGVTTGVGLYLIGVPLALALGLVAGLLDFIPYIGPILAAVPAVLIAFSQGPVEAFYVVLLFIGIQMMEGYLLLPLVERRSVSLPPALNITMQILLAVPFGLFGIAMAAPLTAMLIVLVEMLYVQDVLGDSVTLPTERK